MNKLKWKIFDGAKPGRDANSGTFNIRAPFGLEIPPGQSAPLKLGVSCNYPLQLFQARGLLQRGVTVLSDQQVVDFDQEIVVIIKNSSVETAFIERGDTIIKAAALDNTYLDVEA